MVFLKISQNSQENACARFRLSYVVFSGPFFPYRDRIYNSVPTGKYGSERTGIQAYFTQRFDCDLALCANKLHVVLLK